MRFLIPFSVLWFPLVSYGALWYVDKDAVGSNNGTSWANAWNEMNQVIWANINAGDTIYVGGGTYSTDLRVQKAGTAGSRILIKASQEAGHNDPIVHNATIGGYASGSYFTIDGAITDGVVPTNTFTLKSILPTNVNWYTKGGVFNGVGGCNHVTLKWLSVSNLNGVNDTWGIQWNNENLVSNVVEYCWLHDIEDTGIAVGAGNTSPAFSDFTVRWCYLTNTGDDFYEGQPGATLHNNYFERTGYRHGHPDGIAGPMGQMYIYNNVLVDVWDQIIYLKIWETTPNDHGEVYVYGNLIYIDLGANPPKADGVQTASSYGWETGRPGVPASNHWNNVVIANNTFIASGTTGAGKILNMLDLVNAYAGANIVYITNMVVKNNIFYKSPTSGSSLKGSGADGFSYTEADMAYDYNVVYSTATDGRKITYRGTVYSTAEALNAATAYDYNTSSEPLFVNAAAFNFTPTAADTVARNTGANLTSLGLPGWGIDLAGNSRTVDGFPDRGALEQPTDISLLVHLTFENDFQTDGYVADISGNNRHAWRFGKPGTSYPSNAITPILTTDAAPGLNSGYAGLFRWRTNDWGAYNKSGSYGAITNNMSALTGMSEATIACWHKMDHWNQIIGATDWSADGNATILGTSRSTGVAGTWSLARQNNYSSANQLRFLVMTNNLVEPSNVFVDFPGVYNVTGDSTNWHHVAVTWNSGYFKAFWDGIAVDTATCSTPTLTISQNPGVTTLWIGLGCDPHGGTPPLEDESGEDYPNHGWLNGKIDDVRIYNRVLSDAEILALSGVSGGATTARMTAQGRARLSGRVR